MVFFRGLSEVFVSVLLILITVFLSVFVVLVFFGNLYGPARSELVLQGAATPCVAYVAAVGNKSGAAVLYVYNAGAVPCRFNAAYLVDKNVVDNSFGQVVAPPGNVTRVVTKLEYCRGCVYKLTGPGGEEAVGRAES
ncbi:MAG: flagellar biosynthesis protein FlaG [Pyrobaculum sp.]